MKRRALIKGMAAFAAAAGSLPGFALTVPARGVVDPPHLIPRAKRVVWLYMAGGPSQFESFDEKPELARRHGQPFPDSLTRGQQLAQLQGRELRCLAPQFEFSRWGESGQQISTLFPHIGGVADELCVVRSGVTEQINHDTAHTLMNTGTFIKGRPSFGSWVAHALGSDNHELPGFVVLQSNTPYGSAQPIASHQWGAAFLPVRNQGLVLSSAGEPIHFLEPPPYLGADQQMAALQLSTRLAELSNPEAASHFEMAAQLANGLGEVAQLDTEPAAVLERYGARPGEGSFASNCLLARRLLERGVRFVQLYHRGWDHHTGIQQAMTGSARDVDRATAALLSELRERGLLDDTLLIWGGEFGRSPMAQGDGRDHHIRAFSFFLAGGGTRRGTSYGRTDDLGYGVVENPVHVNDFHATALHLLGIDHKRLTARHLGRDIRLTDVHGSVLPGLIA